ncbi:ATP-binding protein [Thermococcus sp. MV5]|uniref:AAA family ATPase n=1 Tax=Thermococcus sp. MV5 TaxID=1638272 RepID=UPI00143A8F0A|nr:ATP-binding protein [Thermococcus sp. MV5]NJE25232.1 ATP-binding protein [Thermococcus sp. MV5]
MFVNRRRELEILKSAYDSLKKGHRVNLAIIGPRRIGKTELLLKFKESTNGVIPYLNLQRVGTIESFVFAYLRELLYELGKADAIEVERSKLLDWDDLLILAAKLGVENEAKAIKTGDMGVLFELQEDILEKLGQKAVFILDEFQEVRNISSFLELMRAVTEKQENIAYFISGSAVRMMEEILSAEKPFFGQFRRIYLTGLPKEDTFILARAIFENAEIEYSNSALEALYKLTSGHPFYIHAVCRRLIEEGFEKVSKREVEYAFLTELLMESGDIYMHLDYVFNESLSRAYRGPVHREILLILAREEGLKLSEVAKRLGKPSGEVSNYLKFLLRTDLITRENGRYYFTDKLMRFWLAKTYLGITEFELRREKLREELIRELEEKFLKAKIELGLTGEAWVRERLREIIGLDFKPYRRGEIEFDGVAFRERPCVLEVRWRGRPTTYKDVEAFVKKVKSEFGEGDMYFFSKTGFTKNALEACKKLGVKILTEQDLK